jgi:hypothetical protein
LTLYRLLAAKNAPSRDLEDFTLTFQRESLTAEELAERFRAWTLATGGEVIRG